ncbi:hypothetical protein PFICI_14090 [Pestalotiopsis fici W106-1]|uniref:Nudix hydrolase domain-containing protein n=1 Tax=Pestalotiopsis fici (strain W106-1 / CGMCC3.15140) TaxID=1229662 RepID=W3WKH6_PESFW|nr:uncharacterized protein PFICI_14090 [Pestalotiopsis fici W106-1]ETS74224.1 hypothetical protein PFICI_14090 [Pestalotiopsis fici W106-1]
MSAGQDDNWPRVKGARSGTETLESMASSNDKPIIKKRAVAATFLFRFNDSSSSKPGTAEVALFRRSSKVRTYQHKLAPISGSVDPDDSNPLATTLREIKEETSLELGRDIELMRKGKPYSFADHDIGREWTVNPFAFRLKSVEEGGRGEPGITIDWEHDGWEWHDPLNVNDSEEFGGVPRLVDSLRRVWPEIDLGAAAGVALTDGLKALQNDHESGARVLAASAVRILRDVIYKLPPPGQSDDSAKVIRMAAWHLCYNGRESMGAAITSSIVTVLDKIEEVLKKVKTNPEGQKDEVLSEIDKFLEQRDSAVDRLRGFFVEHIIANTFDNRNPQDTLSVLTMSYSSTISGSLLAAARSLNVALDLRILESRPLCEGVTLASKLLEEATPEDNVNVTLYSDASAAIAAQGVDAFLLGADRISAEGDVSNKTGTLPTALSTRYVSPNAKIIVLSEVEKIAGPGPINEHGVEENDPAELWRSWNNTVKGASILVQYTGKSHENTSHSTASVKNIYFEWLPASFVNTYITDEGSWSLKDIRAKSSEIGKQTTRFFSGL